MLKGPDRFNRPALEEALREVGLDPETVRLIAELSPVRGQTALAVQMCVAAN